VVLIGLDLSLTSSGVCCLPLDWDCTPSRCSVATVPYRQVPHDDTERAERLSTVAVRILATARELAAGRGIEAWAVESLPTHNAHALAQLAELHGVVRFLLHQQGARVITANQASARKLLMGKLPTKDIKAMVAATVRSFLGCASWKGDEVDAFVVANWLASELGGVALAA
jgi:Holliday junction resolvasome RuvABC endonuclease subunit